MFKIFNFLYISLIISRAIFSNTYAYEIKLLDRSNVEQVQQVRQLFIASPIQSVRNLAMQDIEKWITRETQFVLLAINKKGLVCGAAIYYIVKNTQLWLRAMIISPAHQHQGIASKLLHRLESVPNVIQICTNITKEHIAFYKLFQKLGYAQTEQYLNMSKSWSKPLILDNNVSKYSIRMVDEHNLTEVAQFAALFDERESGESWSAEGMGEFMTYKNYHFLAFFDDAHQPLGGLIYNTLSTHWKIYILSVHKNYRCRGIATELLKALERLAVKQNIQKLIVSALPTNYVAIACYKKQGFIEEETIFKMEKKLL